MTLFLAYVIALQPLANSVAGAAQAAKRLDPLDPASPAHILCLPSSAGLDGQNAPLSHDDRGEHDLCCTLACGVMLAAALPTAVVAHIPVRLALAAPATADLTARPATAPPGQGRGPRAPPLYLI